MSAMNDGGPAFPRDTKWILDGSVSQSGSKGMSLRDWFAGMALQGLLAGNTGEYSSESYARNSSAHAYQVADAMLAARERKESA